MKYLLAATIFLLLPSVGSAQPAPRAPHIEITSTIERIRTNDGSTFQFYLLWNREVSARPIGHAFYDCSQGVTRTQLCQTIFVLPYGKIVASGMIHTYRTYTLVITGGSQSKRAKLNGHPGYVNIRGVVRAFRIGPGTYSLVFLLSN